MKFNEFNINKQSISEAGPDRDKWDTNSLEWQRREQSAWDKDKQKFKGRELEHELGHETNNYAVVINGRTWKVFADRRQAENIARSLRAKGKDATVYETGLAVSENLDEQLSIGQQMAQDGIVYSPEREKEIIRMIPEYMKKAGYDAKAIRYYFNYVEDFIPDVLSELPREGVDEAALDPSGLIAAAQMVKDYIVTAEVDGAVKKFRVRGMTGERSAKERFLKHHSMAKVLDVKPEQGVAEARSSGYKEIEFICVNPRFPDATDPELQKQMYIGLKKIPNVIPLLQDWDEYSEGQKSLSAIYKDRESRQKILALAKQLGVEIDLEQPVSDDYVDRAIRSEHEGQQGVAEGLNEMDKSAAQPGRDGKVSHSTYGSRDKKGSDYFKGKEAPGKAITAKQASKDALDILKKQGVAEGRFDEPLTGWHIVSRAHGQVVQGTPSFETKDQAQKYLMTRMFANHQDFKVVHTAGVVEADDKFDGHEQAEWDEKMARLKKLAGQGELKTVWDPVKRVYKNVPVNPEQGK